MASPPHAVQVIDPRNKTKRIDRERLPVAPHGALTRLFGIYSSIFFLSGRVCGMVCRVIAFSQADAC